MKSASSTRRRKPVTSIPVSLSPQRGRPIYRRPIDEVSIEHAQPQKNYHSLAVLSLPTITSRREILHVHIHPIRKNSSTHASTDLRLRNRCSDLLENVMNGSLLLCSFCLCGSRVLSDSGNLAVKSGEYVGR